MQASVGLSELVLQTRCGHVCSIRGIPAQLLGGILARWTFIPVAVAIWTNRIPSFEIK